LRRRSSTYAFAFFLAVLAALVLGHAKPVYAANDPGLLWQSLETAHFRISFYSGERELAEHVADIAETVYGSLGQDMQWYPKERVEIALTDQAESANGSATALPYNAINLYVTAPEDLSPLGDVDDWLLELITHEYTHTLQLDQARGLPALVNKIVGRTWMPNQVQPRWILEGLAVVQESEHTSGGRMRSSIWDMQMRADILGDNVASIDQLHHFVRRWPQGNIWYLYGSYFMQFIVDTYGKAAIRSMITDYGGQPVPWGSNRAIRRATGKTFEEMYPVWMQTRYRAQAADIRKKGIREGTRLTRQGQTAAFPRWIPASTSWSKDYALTYHRDNGHTRGGLYGLQLSADRMHVEKSELLARTNGDTPASFLPDGAVVFSSADAHRNIFSFNDLHKLPTGVTSPSGQTGDRIRLTDGFRAAEPDVSKDGRSVVFISNNRGTRYLQMADLEDEGIRNVRALIPSERYEQAFTPRFSPDGTHVAYSAWTPGGYRDIRYVDVRTRTYVEVAHDRAVDGAPSFSADGKYLYFHSDRTGVFNLYAWEIETKKIFQVTNVVSGAFYPEPSPDGKTLAYIGYSKAGFDLFAMPLDPSRFALADAYVRADARPSMPKIASHEKKLVAYNPLHTLAPRKYSLSLTQGGFGQLGVASVKGLDIAGRHAFAITAYTEFARPALQGSIAYTYGALPFDVSISAYRSIVPSTEFKLGPEYAPIQAQESVGLDTSIGFSKGRMFDNQSFSVGYSAARIATDVAFPVNKFDPYETPARGVQGYTAFLHAGYNYSNAERYLHSVSPERGFSFDLDVNVAHPAFASEFRGFTASSDLTGYIPMPWLQHHVLALHGGGGLGGGAYPGRSLFYVGGFTDLAVFDTIRTVAVQGGLVLRGYPPFILTGGSKLLMNAEYRFPILNLDRGLSTLPVFLNRISGNVFFDYGGAFDDFRTSVFKVGAGAEAWFDLLLGYNLGFTFRLGYARGFSSGGIDKSYFVAAIPY
jgi:WD40-like Beta Propeller Repeat/Omp85 superfamily domain